MGDNYSMHKIKVCDTVKDILDRVNQCEEFKIKFLDHEGKNAEELMMKSWMDFNNYAGYRNGMPV